ncbi:MAG: NUDIX hydrolase [Candidatus Aminicenantes bacterium]|nr:NUDIX hydrolase [Candidatus Aminicenantes bacterium]
MPTPPASWSREILALAKEGLTYGRDPFDRARYEKLLVLAADMAAAETGSNPAAVQTLFTAEEGYLTPKVEVRGVLFRQDRILLVSERTDGGRWTLPGGWADLGATPSENVVREIQEETGFEARAVRLLAVYDRDRQGHSRRYFSCYKIYFLCEILGGLAKRSLETQDVEFFAEDALPPLSTDRVTERQIRRMFELRRHPDQGPDFD